MKGFLMRVTARDAPSRIDEARPYYPPNENDETEEGRRATVLPRVRCREAARGAGGPKPVAG
ncbi:hypothetical protein [Burkholderia sp. BE12]|uniref:hypothetical protein n=1 Tax=Burkholderia sp. BE12 TaxID=2082394 RepID=UPI0018F8A32C|nr:hypothetical protein [Burkholderia sp. BE12]